MNDTRKARQYVLDHIRPETAIIMMMEEASECIKECSKILRCMSADPCASTPVETFEAQAKLYEEFNDLLVTADAARILPDDMDTGDNIKWLRWASRTKEAIDHAE